MRKVRRCAAGVWGKVEKTREKKLRNKNITLHHRGDCYIQNLIFHYFTEEERGCVTEREREREIERGRDTFLRPVEYVIEFFYK
jgi:hypothetical protein